MLSSTSCLRAASVKVTINGKTVDADNQETLLEVADRIGVHIPRLCHHPDLRPRASCRVCLTDIDGWIAPACVTKVWDGMKVSTESEKVQRLVKGNLRMLLETHDERCASCVSMKQCIFRNYNGKYKVKSLTREPPHPKEVDKSSGSLRFDGGKCVLCTRCVRACEDLVGLKAIQLTARASHMQVEPAGGKSLAETSCIDCGLCRLYCPVGAFTENPEFTGKYSKILVDAAVLASLDKRKIFPRGVPIEAPESAAAEFIEGTAKELDKSRTLYSSYCPAFVTHVKKANLDLALTQTKLALPSDALIVSNCVAGRGPLTITPRVLQLKLKSEVEPTVKVGPALRALAAAGGLAREVVRSATGKPPSELEENGLKIFTSDGLRAAVVNGLKDLPKVPAVRAHFVEVNVCPGGCIVGGGSQQFQCAKVEADRLRALERL